jgi:hypothetical protein
MPFPTNIDLPPSVRLHLPDHAQDIYRELLITPMRRMPAIPGKKKLRIASPGRP